MARPRRLAPRLQDDPLVLARHPKGWERRLHRSQLARLGPNWVEVEPEKKMAKPAKPEPVKPDVKE